MNVLTTGAPSKPYLSPIGTYAGRNTILELLLLQGPSEELRLGDIFYETLRDAAIPAGIYNL